MQSIVLFYFKALNLQAQFYIHIFILTMAQPTMCNSLTLHITLRTSDSWGKSHSYHQTEQFLSALWTFSGSVRPLFWFYDP